MIKDLFIKYLPWLGKYKRFLYAAMDSISPTKRSYGQHGEDRIVYDLLLSKDIGKGNYVDVGANHPSTISNTYLLYRNGFRGIVIEPNPELIRLFRFFRPGDIALPVGCGARAEKLPFYISRTPVLSSFANATGVIKQLQLPVLPLDEVLYDHAYDTIDFLSIDVEGLTIEVLKGAAETIPRARIICIEYDGEKGIREISQYLSDTHQLYKKLPVNLIFTRKEW